MRPKIKMSELPDFDAAEFLQTDADIAAYLSTVLEENDAGLLAAALGDIARAQGMTQVAKEAGITREALYKALRPGSEPRFETVSRVCAALGVKLVAKPLQAGSTAGLLNLPGAFLPLMAVALAASRKPCRSALLATDLSCPASQALSTSSSQGSSLDIVGLLQDEIARGLSAWNDRFEEEVTVLPASTPRFLRSMKPLSAPAG